MLKFKLYIVACLIKKFPNLLFITTKTTRLNWRCKVVGKFIIVSCDVRVKMMSNTHHICYATDNWALWSVTTSRLCVTCIHSHVLSIKRQLPFVCDVHIHSCSVNMNRTSVGKRVTEKTIKKSSCRTLTEVLNVKHYYILWFLVHVNIFRDTNGEGNDVTTFLEHVCRQRRSPNYVEHRVQKLCNR